MMTPHREKAFFRKLDCSYLITNEAANYLSTHIEGHNVVSIAMYTPQ